MKKTPDADIAHRLPGIGADKTYPNCEFPLLTTNAAYALLAQRVAGRRPTSFLRLGDGEGLFLAAPTPDQSVLWERVESHLGPSLSAHDVERIGDFLRRAIRTTDLLGIREDIVGAAFSAAQLELTGREFEAAFHAAFALRAKEAGLPYKHALRLALLHRELSALPLPPGLRFCSSWDHFRFSHHGYLLRLLRTRIDSDQASGDRTVVGLISSKQRLATELSTRLKIDIDYYPVPEKYVKQQQADTVGHHYPDVFEDTMDRLQVRHRGQLFLVGAGPLGKIYCARIRELGGIALDVGAVCDAWINIPSRRMVLRSLYQHVDEGVPTILLLQHQCDQAE